MAQCYSLYTVISDLHSVKLLLLLFLCDLNPRCEQCRDVYSFDTTQKHKSISMNY